MVYDEIPEEEQMSELRRRIVEMERDEVIKRDRTQRDLSIKIARVAKEYLRRIYRHHWLRCDAIERLKYVIAAEEEIQRKTQEYRQKIVQEQEEYIKATYRKYERRRQAAALQEMQQVRLQMELECIEEFFEMVFDLLDSISQSNDLTVAHAVYCDVAVEVMIFLEEDAHEFWDGPGGGGGGSSPPPPAPPEP